VPSAGAAAQALLDPAIFGSQAMNLTRQAITQVGQGHIEQVT
jgi:hypothetical protein